MIFYFKLAKNYSFGELSSFFQKPKTTIRRIFWIVTVAYFENCLDIPNLMDERCDMEKLFQDLHQDLDPFYKSLFGSFKDPKGNIASFL